MVVTRDQVWFIAERMIAEQKGHLTAAQAAHLAKVLEATKEQKKP